MSPGADHTAVDPYEVLVGFVRALESLPPDDLPGLITRTARLLGADDAVAYLVDLDQIHLRPLGRDGTDQGVDSTIGGRAYRTEQPVLAEDDAGGSQLWAPILDSAERVGVLCMTFSGGPSGLGSSAGTRAAVEASELDLELWRSFGSVVGEAIVSKASYGDLILNTHRSRDVTLAAELRWQLLPPLTFRSGRVKISGILEPAYDIAGDTFDYAINGDIAHVAVLDAMGHGMEASRMANLAATAYRHARRHGLDLDEMLRAADEAIVDQFGGNRYVTGQLATLELRRGELSILNAGHPPPLHFRGSRTLGEVVCEPCRPMGLGPVDTYQSELSLEPGDVVVFHTDGVTESRSAVGETFGVDRLADMVARSLRAGLPSAEVLRQVIQSVYAHSEPPLRDDASLVLLEWVGPGEVRPSPVIEVPGESTTAAPSSWPGRSSGTPDTDAPATPSSS